jgi:hypothetical protein
VYHRLLLAAYDKMRMSLSELKTMKKKSSMPTPHDATFRQFLAQPDIIRDDEIVDHRRMAALTLLQNISISGILRS